MHWTRRAPELSATSRLVCIWIIGFLPTFGGCSRWLPQGFVQTGWWRRSGLQHLPAFGFRPGRAFDDADRVALLAGVGLVMRAVFLGLAHGLLHDRVLEAALDRHGDGLGVGVRGDGALQDSLGHGLRLPARRPRRGPSRPGSS